MYLDILWPWWVRISHWLVAAGVIALWLMSYIWYETDWIHRLVGYAVLLTVLSRIVLGCLTQFKTAQLHLPGIHAIRSHLSEIRSGEVTPYQGHNPLGQWAIYLIWFLITALALTGWLSRTDTLWGEDWPVDLHGVLSFCLLGLICMHVLAIFLISKLSGQYLLSQMIHGRYTSTKPDSE